MGHDTWSYGVSAAEVGTAVVANPVKRNGVATRYHAPSTPELKPLADAHIEVVAACHAMSSSHRQPTMFGRRHCAMSLNPNIVVLSLTGRPLGWCDVPASSRKLGALSLFFEHGSRNRRNGQM